MSLAWFQSQEYNLALHIKCIKLYLIAQNLVFILIIYRRYTGEATGNRYIKVTIVIQMPRNKFICFFSIF